jgi:hypothetical protein
VVVSIKYTYVSILWQIGSALGGIAGAFYGFNHGMFSCATCDKLSCLSTSRCVPARRLDCLVTKLVWDSLAAAHYVYVIVICE